MASQEAPEPDIYYADESYKSRGPVTETEFFAAWQAKKVHGWPDSALVWWTDLEGGWVPLDGLAAKKRFGTRFAIQPQPVTRPCGDELTAGLSSKRQKKQLTAKDTCHSLGQAIQPTSAGVIDLSDDCTREPAVSKRQQQGSSKSAVASAQCIDLVDEEDNSSSPSIPKINHTHDPRLRQEIQVIAHGRQETMQEPQTHSRWSGTPDTSSAQPTDHAGKRVEPFTDRRTESCAGAPVRGLCDQPVQGAHGSANGSLWVRQCKVNGIAPEMVPGAWHVHGDPPLELVDWLRKLLQRAGNIVDVSELRKDRRGTEYSCKITMDTKKAMLNAISLRDLPDRCEAHGNGAGKFLRICNLPRPTSDGRGYPCTNVRGGESSDWGSGTSSSNVDWGGGRGGGDRSQAFRYRDRGQGHWDGGGRRGGYNPGGRGGYNPGGRGGGGFVCQDRGMTTEWLNTRQQTSNRNGWGGGGPQAHDGGAAGWAGSQQPEYGWRGAESTLHTSAKSANGCNDNTFGGAQPAAAATSSGWGGRPDSQQNCTRCGGTGIAGCPHKADCEEVQRSIMAGAAAMCFICGGNGHDMARCPLSSSPIYC